MCHGEEGGWEAHVKVKEMEVVAVGLVFVGVKGG